MEPSIVHPKPDAEANRGPAGSATAARQWKLAVYGLVDIRFGSVTSASSIILSELLGRGHEIDLYAIAGFVEAKEFAGKANYRYRPFEVKWVTRAWKIVAKLPNPLRRIASYLASQSSLAAHERLIASAIHEVNRTERPYDAVLVMGMFAPRGARPTPVIAWPQGCPAGELAGVTSDKRNIQRYCGRAFYLLLSTYYRWRIAAGRKKMKRCDLLLCGSEWTRGEWKKLGMPADRVKAVPYPIDLEHFHPASTPPVAPGKPARLLWLGRVVPRKRLDLMLEALRLLCEEGRDVRLTMIGGFAYVPQYKAMLDDFPLRDRVDYQRAIDRSAVPELMRQADVLVQPSEYEDLGSSIVEALACGTPVVLGNTNGTADYIGSGGRVFAEYAPVAVKNAIASMLDALAADPAGTAAAARRAAEQFVSVDRVVDQVEAAIAQAGVLAKRSFA